MDWHVSSLPESVKLWQIEWTEVCRRLVWVAYMDRRLQWKW